MKSRRFLPAASLCCGLLCCLLVQQASRAADWPTYAHDVRRSGFTEESLDARSLSLRWRWRSSNPPQPAWAGPAKWDAFHRHRGLPEMRTYDQVFHPVVADGRVFFGSSADDSVRCLDLETGKLRWVATTDGPVRIAPTYSEGRLYFGSDDGYAYCLRADDGRQVWRFRPKTPERMIVNNGRLIPLQPCRTGVLVAERTAHFGMGLLPWQTAYLCAVDEQTGKPTGKGRYVKSLDGNTLEGPPAASNRALIFPQGRVGPQMFSKATGKDLGSAGGAGSVVVLAEDATLFQGPAASRTGAIAAANLRTRERIATFDGGAAIAVAGNVSYTLTGNALVATDWVQKKLLWQVEAPGSCNVIVAGETVYIGGEDRVTARSTDRGKLLWEANVDGMAYGLAVADGRLLVSTDTGSIYAFGSEDSDPRDVEPTADESVAADSQATPEVKTPAARLAAGPWLEFTGPAEAVVRWQTREASPTRLEYKLTGSTTNLFEPIVEETLARDHTVKLSGLKRNRTYEYRVQTRIGGELRATPWYECDTFFNFAAPDDAEGSQAYPPDDASQAHAEAAEHILAQSKVRRGLCLVLGAGEGRLAYELAKRSHLRIIGVETDRGKVAAARRALLKTGLYGSRVTIHWAPSFDELPYPGHLANLICADRWSDDGKDGVRAAEVYRMLAPGRGVAVLGASSGSSHRPTKNQAHAWLDAAGFDGKVTDDEHGVWVRIARRPLDGSGEWSHMYGRADNSAFGGETLSGAKRAEDLQLQWIGRPGPRHQSDRQNRKPSPLAANGRLLVQGFRRITALDAYNGCILWSLEMPKLIRFNVHRDSSNWCCDDENVYVAVDDKCWRIDADSGEVLAKYDALPVPEKDWQIDWSYVASQGRLLIGSSIKQGTAYTAWWGPDAFYDGSRASRVCSEKLFAIEKQTGEKVWNYADGVIVNSSITIGDGRVYFLESRNAKVKASDSRRVGMPEFWDDLFLVALDANRGEKIWERPVKLPSGHGSGAPLLAGAYGAGRLIIEVSTDYFHTYAFDAGDGKPLWKKLLPWPGVYHGKHLARPAIVGERLYIRPYVLDMTSGEVLPQKMPMGSCGTYVCSSESLFYRLGSTTMWDPSDGRETGWQRLRPDCWLSTIPAAGMLLSPEGGGGCWCGGNLETSLGFIARLDEPRFATPQRKFAGSLEVVIKPPLAGDRVYYTIDGSTPTTDSRLYKAPIRLTDSATVRASSFRTTPVRATSREIVRQFEKVPARLADAYRVNFQPPDGPRVEGWLVDSGEAFHRRTDGAAYGWSRPLVGAASRWVRPADDEKLGPADAVYDTSISLRPDTVWEIGLENGTYEVTVCVGDAQRKTQDLTLRIGSVEFCKDLDLDQGKFKRLVHRVDVRDGRLALQSNAGQDREDQFRRLNHLEIRRQRVFSSSKERR